MKIRYLGHSSFYLKGKDYSVVTDPFSGIGYKMERVQSDYVISSHGHFDHNAFSEVDAQNVVTGDSAIFKTIPTFHDEVGGKKRGKNDVYKFVLDGITFAHLGDIGQEYTEEFRQKLGRVDVLFIPVGGTYTIDSEEAIRYIKGISPKVAVPMHFKTKNSSIDISPIEDFLSQVEYKTFDKELVLTKETLPQITQIYYIKFDI